MSAIDNARAALAQSDRVWAKTSHQDRNVSAVGEALRGLIAEHERLTAEHERVLNEGPCHHQNTAYLRMMRERNEAVDALARHTDHTNGSTDA